MTKKTVSLLLCVILVLSTFVFAYAAVSVSSKASASSVKAGDKVTITVSVKGAASSKSFGISTTYDKNVFEFVEHQCLVKGTIMDNYDGKNAVCTYPEKIVSGDVWKFTFKAKKDAPVGSYTFKNALKFEGSNAISSSVTVKIACTHSYGEWKLTTKPACTKEGVETRTCSKCGATETRKVAALGHSYGEWKKTADPTCTKSGTETRICSVCGNKDTREIKPTGHSFGESKVTKEPTCTQPGEKTETCKICGAKEKKTIPALGHELTNAAVTKAATCSSHGQETGLCTRCGEIVTVETPFSDHSWGAWFDKKEANCTEGGVRAHVCDICEKEETAESFPLGHDYSQGEVIREATVYQEGLYEASCTRCGAKGRITTPCLESFDDIGLIFEADPGTFEPGTQIFAELQEPEEEGESEIYTRYAISFASEENEVQPKNAYTITFPIPEGYGRNISVNLVDKNGNKTEIPCIINLYDNTVKILTNGTGSFEIVNLDKVPPVYEGLSPEERNFLIMGSLGFTTLLFFLLYITKKPKKKKKSKEGEMI